MPETDTVRETDTGPGTAQPSRRQVLLTGGVVAAAAAVTAACGSSTAGAPAPTPTTSAPAVGPTVASSSPAAATGDLSTADVPVGGGTVLQDKQVVVTQPTAGQFKAFSAVCTHQGCLVAGVENGVIVCPCHMSTFSPTDGSVQGGPAPTALASVPLTVSGTSITVG